MPMKPVSEAALISKECRLTSSIYIYDVCKIFDPESNPWIKPGRWRSKNVPLKVWWDWFMKHEAVQASKMVTTPASNISHKRMKAVFLLLGAFGASKILWRVAHTENSRVFVDNEIELESHRCSDLEFVLKHYFSNNSDLAARHSAESFQREISQHSSFRNSCRSRISLEKRLYFTPEFLKSFKESSNPPKKNYRILQCSGAYDQRHNQACGENQWWCRAWGSSDFSCTSDVFGRPAFSGKTRITSWGNWWVVDLWNHRRIPQCIFWNWWSVSQRKALI